MASESVNPVPVADHLKPAIRKRLNKLMEHGAQQTKQGNHDYAHDMYASCVNKDPGNLEYVEAFLSNLEAKFKNNKKGGRSKGNRSELKKAVAEKNWKEVIEYGTELLKYNPWDAATLRPIADACEALALNEVELRYLKNALTSNPKDIDINRHCATSLARMGQFDQAIACWHRIEELSKNLKPEARKMISQLTMAKTRIATGITDEELVGEVASASSGQASPAATKSQPKPKTATAAKPPAAEPAPAKPKTAPNGPETATSGSGPAASGPDAKTKYEEAIVAAPAEISNYLQLAKIHQTAGDLELAQEVLTRAQDASGNALEVQERLESIQLLMAQRELAAAEQALKRKPKNAKLQASVTEQKETLNRRELDYYGRRNQRYPDDNKIKYELAIRLKRARNFSEANKYFDQAAAEEKLFPLAKLNQGECLQQTRQYREALVCYEISAKKALESDQIPAHKLALYRAGMLATGLKDHDQAVHFFEQLTELDPDFRDSKLRLDKARKMSQTN